jgi:hypothetical protein
MNLLLRAAAVIVALCVLPPAVHASDPSGNWTWTHVVRPGLARDARLTVVLKGNRVVGGVTMPGPRGEHSYANIAEGTYEGGVLEFHIERDINGQKVKTKFRGKFLGQFINGTIEEPGLTGLNMTREWAAKRVM